MVCVLILAPLFSSLVLFVVVVAALFFFAGLQFDLAVCFMHAYIFSLFVLSLRRDLNKNSSNPSSYLRRDQRFCSFYTSSPCLM